MRRLLLLSSDSLLNKLFTSGAKKEQLHTITSSYLDKGIEIIKKGHCEAIVANIPFLSERCPKKIVQRIQDVNSYIPIFVLMDHLDIHQAISLTKMGVEYCYSKPFAFEQIFKEIDNIIEEAPPNKAVTNYQKKDDNAQPHYLQAGSQAATFLYHQIDKVADTHFKVIIYGETGTGKESVARRLCNGIFKDKPFIPVDCGCLNKELAASELFGHKKGSFSGAVEEKKGAFEAANGGTLFLDEIGNLDHSVQALLLRAIEEKRIKKVGSNEEINVDVRIIAASNEKLSLAVENGSFRQDLYHRLNEFEIIIPPLRARVEDIVPFIDFFIREANEELGKEIKGVQSELLEKLTAYTWPGNIRELKNIIRRGCLMATNMITPACLSDEFSGTINNHIKGKAYPENLTFPVKKLRTKRLVAEYEEIVRILKEENYNKTKAAQRLNINRKTLYNKLKAFDTLV